MANIQLPNDVVRTFAGVLTSLDSSGNPVPNPGAVFTAVSSNPAVLNVVVGGPTGTDVTVNATGPNTIGTTITFSETGGAPEAALVTLWDTVEDVTPNAVGASFLVFSDVAQPVPSQTPVAPPGP